MKTSRGDVAAGTWIFRRDRRPPLGTPHEARARLRAKRRHSAHLDAAAADLAEQVVAGASREDRRRVAALLEQAYRGEHEFFASPRPGRDDGAVANAIHTPPPPPPGGD